MSDRFREKDFYSEIISKGHKFNQSAIVRGFYILVCTILIILAIFSSNPYLKFTGTIAGLSILLYFFLFRVLALESRFKKPQKKSLSHFYLLERLEQASLPFIEGKNKDKFASLLKDFFCQLLQTQSFLLFLRDKETFRLFNLNKNAGFKKRSIKIDEPFIKLLKKQADSLILNLREQGEPLAELSAGLKRIKLRSAIPLKVENDLIGMVLFSSDKLELSEEKQRLLNLVSSKLLWIFEMRSFKIGFQKKKREYLNKFGEEKVLDSLSEAEVKRKIFDLHSLFQAANQLYLSFNQNRLFYNFTQILKRQLSASSLLIFLPEAGGRCIKARYSEGIEFLQFSDICLEEHDPLYAKFKKEQSPFYLFNLIKEYQENELLARSLGQGLQICYPLKLPDKQLGLVFLGGRTEGLRYKEEDFTILCFLNDVLNVGLKNIVQYGKLEELSYTDSLSGLYNYRYFCKRLNEEIFRAKRYQRKLALAIFDIDEFKLYNDSFGHQSGDQIIKQLSEQILKVVRSIDVVCRYGGDEFCVIMPETNQEECFMFIQRLGKHIQQHTFKNEFLQLKHRLTLSAGAAIYPQHARTSERLIYCADMALLKAKSSGRNKAFVYSREESSVKSAVPL